MKVIQTIDHAIKFIEGLDEYTTHDKTKAEEIFRLWLQGKRLPTKQVRLNDSIHAES